MPNWCDNDVTVQSDNEDDILWFKEQLTDDALFNNILPMPKELNEDNPSLINSQLMIDKYGAKDWYEWCLKNWGVKWDASEIMINYEAGTEIQFSFLTPWGPPVIFYEKMVQLYPQFKIEAHWSEPGMGIVGRVTVEKDNIEYHEGIVADVLDLHIVYYLNIPVEEQSKRITRIREKLDKVHNYYLRKWKTQKLVDPDFDKLDNIEDNTEDYLSQYFHSLQKQDILTDFSITKYCNSWEEYTLNLIPFDLRDSLHRNSVKRLGMPS